MLVKVCGILDNAHLNAVTNTEAQWIGFNFYNKSKRFYQSEVIKSSRPVIKVGVFVNASLPELEKKVTQFSLDYVQLHGNEDVVYCKRAKTMTKVIKVFSIDEKFDFKQTNAYNFCDYFLFDTKCENFGGSGHQFNWDILKEYKGPQGFLLAGGIGLDSISALKKLKHKYLLGFDINSKFEIIPGIKDVNLIQEFITQIKDN